MKKYGMIVAVLLLSTGNACAMDDEAPISDEKMDDALFLKVNADRIREYQTHNESLGTPAFGSDAHVEQEKADQGVPTAELREVHDTIMELIKVGAERVIMHQAFKKYLAPGACDLVFESNKSSPERLKLISDMSRSAKVNLSQVDAFYTMKAHVEIELSAAKKHIITMQVIMNNKEANEQKKNFIMSETSSAK